MQRSDQVVGRQLYVGEEDLVELGLAGHLLERADLHAGQVHREHEERDALVLLRLGVGAGHEDAPVAVPPAAAPHLLAVDDEAVSVAFGLGGKPAEVAAGARFAEQLAPHVVAGERGGQVLRLLLVGAVAQQCATGEHEAHHVEDRRHPGECALQQPGSVVLGRQPAAAVLYGPVDAGVARSIDAAVPREARLDERRWADRAVVARRIMAVRGEPVVRLGLELLDGDHHLRTVVPARRVAGAGTFRTRVLAGRTPAPVQGPT